jgi:trans-aconitate methyltransferase
MNYADITFKDRNFVKRYLQRQRLVSAVNLSSFGCEDPKAIVDFGGGNGELCKMLSLKYPESKIICYEPTPDLLAEARKNLKDFPRVETYSKLDDFSHNLKVDLLFCLEVFEHLPSKETSHAINDINSLLSDHGTAIIGVPVEIYLPALYRGLFRLTRRLGSFDTKISNILRSTLGVPPTTRPSGEIAPGFEYYFTHMGFDYRNLKKTLVEKFELVKYSTSPFGLLTTIVEPEINFIVTKK